MKLPQRSPSATWHSPAQCQGAQQDQGSDTASAPTTLHFTPALTRQEEQSVRHRWTEDLVQTQIGHFPPLTPSKPPLHAHQGTPFTLCANLAFISAFLNP